VKEPSISWGARNDRLMLSFMSAFWVNSGTQCQPHMTKRKRYRMSKGRKLESTGVLARSRTWKRIRRNGITRVCPSLPSVDGLHYCGNRALVV
jgi:hypothetical protein